MELRLENGEDTIWPLSTSSRSRNHIYIDSALPVMRFHVALAHEFGHFVLWEESLSGRISKKWGSDEAVCQLIAHWFLGDTVFSRDAKTRLGSDKLKCEMVHLLRNEYQLHSRITIFFDTATAPASLTVALLDGLKEHARTVFRPGVQNTKSK